MAAKLIGTGQADPHAETLVGRLRGDHHRIQQQRIHRAEHLVMQPRGAAEICSVVSRSTRSFAWAAIFSRTSASAAGVFWSYCGPPHCEPSGQEWARRRSRVEMPRNFELLSTKLPSATCECRGD